ncbi:MAG: hypothetical protein V3U92_15350 [Cellulophaga sp.]
MSKIFTLIFIAIAIGLIAYNVTLVDFEKPFEGDSIVALIGITAALCAIILLLIFSTSKKIEKKIDKS